MKADNRTLLVVAACTAAAAPAFGAGIPTGTPLEEIVVTAQRIGLIGESRAASEGIVTSVQLQGRPILRPGEVLEVVPGPSPDWEDPFAHAILAIAASIDCAR